MRPIVSQLFGKTSFGGSHRKPATAGLLLLLCLGFRPSVATCPHYCLCACDIISCSGSNLSVLPFDLPNYATRLDLSYNAFMTLPTDWIPQRSDQLAALLLSRNSISQIEVNAFTVVPHLLHLDLSSNQLTVLNSSIFSGLKDLKELLLFGNQIIQINPGAFNDLHSLQRLYLSGNRLTSFPLGLLEPGGPRNLTLLDLSHNRLAEVPVQSLLSVTHQCGIYLQENPLVCDCALQALLEYWIWKQYRPLVDFRGEYPCRAQSKPGPICRQQGIWNTPLEAQTFRIEPGKSLIVPCPGLTSSDQEGIMAFWVTPGTVVNSSTYDSSAHLIVLPNGTLEIQRALTEDSGTYECVAARGRYYDTYESVKVKVVVGNLSAASSDSLSHRSGAEHFNTAFTTLASCVVSIILVLLYLYLTPCRCREGPGGGTRGCGGRAIVLCSDPRDVDSEQRRSNGKRVAFLEPQTETSTDIGSPKTPAIYLGHVTTEGILKNGSRTVGQTLTDTAHMA